MYQEIPNSYLGIAELIGMTEDTALQLICAKGFKYLIVERDGEPFEHPVPGRFNLKIADQIVVDCTLVNRS